MNSLSIHHIRANIRHYARYLLFTRSPASQMIVTCVLSLLLVALDAKSFLPPPEDDSPERILAVSIRNKNWIVGLAWLPLFGSAAVLHATRRSSFAGSMSNYFLENNTYPTDSIRRLTLKPQTKIGMANIDVVLLPVEPPVNYSFHFAGDPVFGEDPEEALKIAADMTAGINYREFRGTSWEDSLKNKQQRNLRHAEQNEYSLMLVSYQGSSGCDTRDWIGFTHVLPLTREGLDSYRGGRIRDNQLDSRFVSNPQQESAALLLFTFALDNNKGSSSGGLGLKTEGHVCALIRAMHYHIIYLVGHYRRSLNDPVKLLVQVDDSRILRILTGSYGFAEESGYSTADNVNLLSARAILADSPLVQPATMPDRN